MTEPPVLVPWFRNRTVGRQLRDVETLFNVFIVDDKVTALRHDEDALKGAVSEDRNRAQGYATSSKLKLLLLSTFGKL